MWLNFFDRSLDTKYLFYSEGPVVSKLESVVSEILSDRNQYSESLCFSFRLPGR